MSKPTPEQEQGSRRVIEWLLGDDTGISSKALVAHMLGVDGETMAPWDASDRGRCIRLLKLMPEWIPRLDEMASVNNAWKACLPLIKAGLSQPTSDSVTEVPKSTPKPSSDTQVGLGFQGLGFPDD